MVVEAIGGEVTEESKVRNKCDSYDVSIMMNVKGAKLIEPLLNTSLFTVGTCDMKNSVLWKKCRAQNSAK